MAFHQQTEGPSRPAGRQRGRRLGLVAGGLFLAVGLAISQLVTTVMLESVDRRLDETAIIIASSLQDSLDDISRNLQAGAGFLLGSEEVTVGEFSRFAETIGEVPGQLGWGIVAVVPDAELAGYVEAVQTDRPFFGVFTRIPESSESSGVMYEFRRAEVDLHLVVMLSSGWFHGSIPAGLDLGGEPEAATLIRAIRTGRLTSSAAIPVGRSGEQGFVVVAPVNGDDLTVDYLTMAPVALDGLIGANVPASTLAEMSVSLSGRGAAPPEVELSRYRRTADLAVGDQSWRLTIDPRPGADALLSDWTRLTLYLASLFLAALAGLATSAVVNRRETELAFEATLRLNEARDEFLGAVSHEIRTPLTAAIGFSEELRHRWRDFSDDERDEMLRLVDEQGREVAAIVADLLVVTRADISSLHLSIGDIPLEDSLRLALDSLSAERRDAIAVDIQGVWIKADRGRTSQVLRNLVVNAIRYGGPEMRVDAEHIGDQVAVTVSDNGPGIPPGHEEAVFDAYFKVPADGQAMPSIGLGLFVARRLAEVMGGSLTYRRTNGLSVFELKLPAALPAEAPSRVNV